MLVRVVCGHNEKGSCRTLCRLERSLAEVGAEEYHRSNRFRAPEIDMCEEMERLHQWARHTLLPWYRCRNPCILLYTTFLAFSLLVCILICHIMLIIRVHTLSSITSLHFLSGFWAVLINTWSSQAWSFQYFFSRFFSVHNIKTILLKPLVRFLVS